MTSVMLGDVTSFVRGVTFKPSEVVDQGIGIMRTKNVQEHLQLSDIVRIPRSLIKRDEQFLREGDTLISSANSWNIVGKGCWVPRLPEPLAIGGFVTALRPKPSLVHPRYLYRWYTTPATQAELRSFSNRTTSISNLNLTRAGQMRIPLPPLVEQRRIAAILDRADAIRAERRRLLAHLDSLVRAVFHDMFGEAGDARWERIPFAEVVPRVDNGTSPNCESRPADDHEWGVLKLGAVTYGRFQAAQNKAYLGDVGNMTVNEVRAGDVLMTRKNTRDLVGAVALVDRVRPKLLIPDLIFRLHLDPTYLDRYYFQALMMDPGKRPLVRDLSSGSASSMPNISKARLATLPIEVPPLTLQRKFAHRIGRINLHRASIERAISADDELFASLQSRAFRGEL